MRFKYLLLVCTVLGISYSFFTGGCGTSDKANQEGSLATIGNINTASWMSDGAAILGNIPLNQTALVTAHDTGTYAIDTSITSWAAADLSPDVNDEDSGTFRAGQALGIVGKWAKTQTRTALQMLEDGVRQFDIRVCVDAKGNLMTCHSIYGASIDSILSDVKSFVDSHAKEIIILSFWSFWDAAYPNGANKQGLTADHLNALLNLVKTKLAGKLSDGTKFGPTSTFNQMWSGANSTSTNQIIADFGNVRSYMTTTTDPLIWTKQSIADGTWVTKTDMTEFKSALKSQTFDRQAAGEFKNLFFNAQTQITPDTQMITRGFLVGGPFPSDNQSLADQGTQFVLYWIAREFSGQNRRNVNLIGADHYDRSEAVKLSLWLNGLLPANTTFSFDSFPSYISWSRWNCPANFRDDGFYCAKPAPYGVGTGYPWKFGDALNLNGAKNRCAAENPQGCEQNGLIIYPKCRSGYHKVGCCICSPDCPAGWTDIGVSCKK